MNKLIIFLLISIPAIILQSCSGKWVGEPLSDSAKKVAAKGYNATAIPPDFNKKKSVLLVISDLKSEGSQARLETIMGDYEGKYRVIGAKEKTDKLVADSKSHYILYIKSYGMIDGAGNGMSYNNLYVSCYLQDVQTGEKFNQPFASSKNWSLNVKYFLFKLNEKLHEQ